MRSVLTCLFLTTSMGLTAQGIWTERASLSPGVGRWGAAHFVINGIGYSVGGYTGSSDLSEVRAYDPITNTWSLKAPIPGARRLSSGFSINGKGYVTCGLYNVFDKYNDLWEYDPTSNTWTQRASLPAAARYGTTTFTVNGIGYVVCGNLGSATGPYTSELWAYNPVTNSWSQRADLPDLARYGASGFETSTAGYLIGGRLSDQTFSNGSWSYDPGSNLWSSKAALPGVPRTFAATWSAFGRGILVGGSDLANTDLDECWSYDPSLNSWTSLPDHPGDGNWAGVAFHINGRLFYGTGRYDTTIASDLWEFQSHFTGVDESNAIGELSIGPNPCTPGGSIRFEMDDDWSGISTELVLANTSGQVVFRGPIVGQGSIVMPVPDLALGSYTALVRSGGRVLARAVLVLME